MAEWRQFKNGFCADYSHGEQPFEEQFALLIRFCLNKMDKGLEIFRLPLFKLAKGRDSADDVV